MNIRALESWHARTYREAASEGDAGAGAAVASDEGEGESLLPAATAAADPAPKADPAAPAAEWFYADGVKGEGPPPEWYKAGKYKSLADQAKAYTDLEKKLGAFTGAPEEYELSLPEGVEGELDSEDPLLAEFVTTAKELNISQEAFNKILHMFVKHDAASQATHKEQEIAALGEKAAERLQTVAQWGANNLDPEGYQTLRAFATTAAGVKLIEQMIGQTREGRIAPGGPEGGAAATSGHTPESLRAMKFAKDEGGQLKTETDPSYREAVRKAYQEYYGTEPAGPQLVGKR